MIKEIIKIAEKAGDLILSVYNQNAPGMQIDYKHDSSPLTIADTLSNQYINSSLLSLYPEIPIISEENKQIPFENRKDFDLFWSIDPLDGTKEFIKRNGEFTVNIALIKDNFPVLGVIYCPINGTVYYAEKGKGAFKSQSTSIQELKVPEYSQDNAGVRIICSRSHLNEETQSFIKGFNKPEIRTAGSSLKFMLIAEGEADIYPRLGPTMEWDTAAAQIILEEAGGTIIDHFTGNRMKYNKETLLNNSFVAAGKLVTKPVKEFV